MARKWGGKHAGGWWKTAGVSPDVLCRPQTDPLFLKGPASGDHRIRFVGINAQVLDGFVEDGTLDLAIHEKLMQRGHGDEAGVDLEKVAQRSAAFAASEAIGAE